MSINLREANIDQQIPVEVVEEMIKALQAEARYVHSDNDKTLRAGTSTLTSTMIVRPTKTMKNLFEGETQDLINIVLPYNPKLV